MTTIPCKDCNGEGVIGNDECPRPRCIGGQIELTEAEARAMEAEQCNERT